MSKLVIAIDGPAGAGKSTVAKALAKDLGLCYLDTGAMYRALALAASRAGMSPESGEDAAQLAESLEISFGAGDPPSIWIGDEDVTTQIRTPEIGELASALSTHPGVRRVMVKQQQAMVADGGYTLEGRDVTTVVAPHAQVKVYLTASLEERAKRRHLEMEQKGLGELEYSELRKQMQTRDHRDITREDSPLAVAPGATIVESGGLPIEGVVNRIKALIPPGY
ncbi:MAG: (d)CMP kinase [Fimbriimonadaceae bacterium]|nr:(d)CMP kinase [Fimbriimonadaceae bacterium]